MGLEVTDYIKIQVVTDPKTKSAIDNNLNYICSKHSLKVWSLLIKLMVVSF